jgi:hypothetical protein
MQIKGPGDWPGPLFNGCLPIDCVMGASGNNHGAAACPGIRPTTTVSRPSRAGVLESADGEARLMVYVEENEGHLTPASFVRTNLTTPTSQIDYRRITDRLFAVSGVHEGRIFYSRCNFPDGRNGAIHCIFLSYKSSEKEAWDDIVTHISLSLRPK